MSDDTGWGLTPAPAGGPGLAGFIAARLAEDQATAEGAARTDDGHHGHWVPLQFGHAGLDARVDDHIALHDPARVLRQVTAIRAILAEHAEDPQSGRCIRCGDWQSEDEGTMPWPCPTVRAVGTFWNDSPEYDPEWAPES